MRLRTAAQALALAAALIGSAQADEASQCATLHALAGELETRVAAFEALEVAFGFLDRALAEAPADARARTTVQPAYDEIVRQGRVSDEPRSDEEIAGVVREHLAGWRVEQGVHRDHAVATLAQTNALRGACPAETPAP